MKGDHQVVAAIVIFFLGALFGSFLDGAVDVDALGDYLVACVTLLAAFAGVWFAFRLHDKREERC